MIRKVLIIWILFFCATGSLFAQKVKYKDLLVLLNAKQYDQAEPFLKRYIVENSDNVSALLFMGIILQEKSAKDDVLKQTDLLASHIDSAILYYEKTLPGITEKEIKRNDENYVMYTRRDFRTGEFGIKISDIKLDLENRIKGLRERKQNVLTLKKYYLQSEVQYNKSKAQFQAIQQKYASEKELYLRSDDQLLSELNALSVIYDSCQTSFKNYKSYLQLVGKTNYNQAIVLNEIKNFKRDGITDVDFYSNQLPLWDYTLWTSQVSQKINDEIVPLRKELLQFDSELNKIREKIKTDSIALQTEVTTAYSNSVFDKLKRLDSDAMPNAVFLVKLKELEYGNELAHQKAVSVEADPSGKINILKHEIKLLGQLDSISSIVNTRNFEEDQLNYKNYVSSAYGTLTVLKSLVKSANDYAKREGIRKHKELETAIHQLKWLLVESDSIPLFKEVDERYVHRPLIITNDYTSGIKLTDSLAVGYFYGITPSRTADLSVHFTVDTASVKERNLPLIKAMSLVGTDLHHYVLIYSESKIGGKYPATVAKINRKTGLVWSNPYSFEYTPVELKVSPSNGELSIRTTSTDGDSKMVVVDATGVRQQ